MTNAPDTTELTGQNQEHGILVATDFSEDSMAALIWACHFADCTGSQPVLLHVVHDPVSRPGFYRKSKEDRMKPMHAVAESMMAGFLNEAITEHPELDYLNTVDQRFVPGLPPSRIVEVAKLLDVVLIVVGSRGITGLPHRLMGSTAERVVELAPMPVVVVKAEHSGKLDKKEIKRKEKRQKKERKKLKEILGLNQKPESEGAVDG
jgi:nucleotide-binding universal stress UspA family protein